MREKVLKVYKQLLLSSKQTFGEDQETLSKVVQNVRAKFKDNKEEKDPAKIEEKIKAAEDATNFIQNNIVQGSYSEGSSTLKLKLPKRLPSNLVIEPINKVRIK